MERNCHMAEKIRSGNHMARGDRKSKKVFNDRHADRNFDTAKAKNIDPALSKGNLYIFYDDNNIAVNAALTEGSLSYTAPEDCEALKMKLGTDHPYFRDWEFRIYKDHFTDYLTERNAFQTAQGHKGRCKTMSQYKRDNINTAPERLLVYLGTKENHADAATLTAVFFEFMDWHLKTFPQIRLLDAALHVDEPDCGPHFDRGQVWIGHDRDGREMVSQAKALEEMHVAPPYPEELYYLTDEENAVYQGLAGQAKKDYLHEISVREGKDPVFRSREGNRQYPRDNNPKITYTARCRAKQIELARAHGIAIEDKPREKSKQGRKIDAYKADKEIERAEKAAKAYEESAERLSAIDRSLDALRSAEGGILIVNHSFNERQGFHKIEHTGSFIEGLDADQVSVLLNAAPFQESLSEEVSEASAKARQIIRQAEQTGRLITDQASAARNEKIAEAERIIAERDAIVNAANRQVRSLEKEYEELTRQFDAMIGKKQSLQEEIRAIETRRARLEPLRKEHRLLLSENEELRSSIRNNLIRLQLVPERESSLSELDALSQGRLVALYPDGRQTVIHEGELSGWDSKYRKEERDGLCRICVKEEEPSVRVPLRLLSELFSKLDPAKLLTDDLTVFINKHRSLQVLLKKLNIDLPGLKAPAPARRTARR